MTASEPPEAEIVARRFTENGCEVTSIIYDPADAQPTLYGTVTRHGRLVGSYYCADRVRQSGWCIVTALGRPFIHDGRTVRLDSEPAAVYVLTTVLTAPDSAEAEQRFREFLRTSQ